MGNDLGGLVRLQKWQIEPASEVLSRAFIDDPQLVWLVPEPPKRVKLLRFLFRVALNHGTLHGEVYAVSPDMEGIALWLPSDAPVTGFWTLIRHGGLSLLFKASRNYLWNWAFLRKMRQDEAFAFKLRRHLAPFLHWYLSALGVDPKFQGRGYASRLLQPMLNRLDAANLPCYVETSIEEYTLIYQHFGFKVIDEAIMPGSNTKMWAMLRKND